MNNDVKYILLVCAKRNISQFPIKNDHYSMTDSSIHTVYIIIMFPKVVETFVCIRIHLKRLMPFRLYFYAVQKLEI